MVSKNSASESLISVKRALRLDQKQYKNCTSKYFCFKYKANKKNEQNTDQLFTDQSQELNETTAASQLFEVTTSNIDYKILR